MRQGPDKPHARVFRSRNRQIGERAAEARNALHGRDADRQHPSHAERTHCEGTIRPVACARMVSSDAVGRTRARAVSSCAGALSRHVRPVRRRRRAAPPNGAHAVQPLRAPRQRVAARPAGPQGRPSALYGQQRLRVVRRQDVHQLPPFPARAHVAVRRARGEPGDFRDGQFICWVAGVGPGVLFLVLEKLRRTVRSGRTELDNLLLSRCCSRSGASIFSRRSRARCGLPRTSWASSSRSFLLFALDAARPAFCGPG